MFGISFGKLIVLVAVIAAVWYGFKYIGRLQDIEKGERKPLQRTMSERLRRSSRKKSGSSDTDIVEETIQCPKCGTYIAVGAEHDCCRSGS